MKKLLLMAALAASFSTAYADGFSDIFKLTYNGETIQNGQTVVVANYYDPVLIDNPEIAELIPGYESTYESKATIVATNISDEPWEFEFTLTRTAPTLAEFPSTGSEIGHYQLCFNYSDGSGNCLPVINDKISSPSDLNPIGAEEFLAMDIDQMSFTNLTPVTMQLDLRVTEGGEVIEGGSATIFINFTHEKDITNAVETITIEGAPEYFNLQGMRVETPQKGGLYIMRKGSFCSKVIF